MPRNLYGSMTTGGDLILASTSGELKRETIESRMGSRFAIGAECASCHSTKQGGVMEALRKPDTIKLDDYTLSNTIRGGKIDEERFKSFTDAVLKTAESKKVAGAGKSGVVIDYPLKASQISVIENSFAEHPDTGIKNIIVTSDALKNTNATQANYRELGTKVDLQVQFE